MPLAEIHVILKPALFDAQGATVLKALHQLGHSSVRNARIGKYITLEIEGADAATLQGELDLMCRQLLANPIIEDYEITLSGLPGEAGPAVAATAAEVPAVTGRAPGGAGVAGVAASVAAAPEPVTSAGGLSVTDPFAVDYLTYEAMTTEVRLALRALALQKHGAWIIRELQSRGAAWILCAGHQVVESGDTLDTYPSEQHQREVGAANNIVPWVFTAPSA